MPYNNPHWGSRTRDPSTLDLLAELSTFRLNAESPDLRLQAQHLIDSLRFSEISLSAAEHALAALQTAHEDSLEPAPERATATSPQPPQAQVAPNLAALESLKATLTRRLRSARSQRRIRYFARRLTACNFAILRAHCAQPHPTQKAQVAPNH